MNNKVNNIHISLSRAHKQQNNFKYKFHILTDNTYCDQNFVFLIYSKLIQFQPIRFSLSKAKIT